MKKLLYLLLLLLVPWHNQAQAPVASSKIAYTLPRDTGLLLLPVLVRYEDIYTDAPLDPALHKGRETSEIFDSIAHRVLLNHGIRLKLADPADSSQSKLMTLTSNLLRPIVPQNSWQILTAATVAAQCRYVVVSSIRVKVGPGGYWDPFSGAIGASSSYARFHMALIDVSSTDRKPRWTQDVELRKLPLPRADRYVQAIQLLFQLLK